MLFTQDRTRIRELFCSSWRKHKKGQPLEPLEKQIASLVVEHPEYHALLADSANSVDKDFTADDGYDNPFMHLSLHLALREQVGTDRPAGIASITRSLLLKHKNGHIVEHLMMERLGLFLWDAQRQGRAPNEDAYMETLKELL